MTQDPKGWAQTNEAGRSSDQEPVGNATAFLADSPSLSEVAHTLSAHGGGAVSVDLAFDLVLNEVVQQARNATGASGAAIALFRDGLLTCRATTGENAPDLGVRVDASSGLAGACVAIGEMQECRDTEADSRVNAESCRRLGVRSMLIAPIVDRQKIIGIMQVFSAWPNAFGKREISALQVLAGRIAESNREVVSGISVEDTKREPTAKPEPPVESTSAPTEETLQFDHELRAEGKRIDIWGTALVVLVIAAALALGLAIGWRRAAEFTKSGGLSRPSAIESTATNASVPETAQQETEVPNGKPSAPETEASGSARATIATDAPPAGGLVVTQNGKIVYRSPSASPPPSAARSQRAVIHRVEPEYPQQARSRHIQGAVVLDVQVLGSGEIGSVGIVSGDPLLAQSAIDAVKQWRFQQQVVNGQPVESQARITFKFKLPAS